MYQYARSKQASSINLIDDYENLRFRYMQELSKYIAQKIGWKVNSYSDTSFLLRGATTRDYVSCVLKDLRLSFEFSVSGKNGQATARAVSPDSLVHDLLWHEAFDGLGE